MAAPTPTNAAEFKEYIDGLIAPVTQRIETIEMTVSQAVAVITSE